MLFMFVTLDVSKLSGWLNVTAPCRVETSKGGHAMREEVRPGRREGIGGGDDASGMHGEAPIQGWGPGHARSARRTWHACP